MFQRFQSKNQLPTPSQIEKGQPQLEAYGTSDGVKKSWQSRARRRKFAQTKMNNTKLRKMQKASDRAATIRDFRERTLAKRRS